MPSELQGFSNRNSLRGDVFVSFGGRRVLDEAGGGEEVDNFIENTGRRVDDAERVEFSSSQTRLFEKFPAAAVFRRFTRVETTGRYLKKLFADGRPRLAYQRNRTIGVERENSHAARVTNDLKGVPPKGADLDVELFNVKDHAGKYFRTIAEFQLSRLSATKTMATLNGILQA